jgi:hypothetical protein
MRIVSKKLAASIVGQQLWPTLGASGTEGNGDESYRDEPALAAE